MENRKAEILMAAMLLTFVFLISRHAGLMVSGQNVTAGKKQPVVVLDSGHGGTDPGKIGVDGSLEKDINLPESDEPFHPHRGINMRLRRNNKRYLPEES